MAKRLDSRYEPGRRTGAWIKIKHIRRQELVIGGWLPGEGRRDRPDRRAAHGLLRPTTERAALRRARRHRLHRAHADELARTLAPLRRDDSPFDAAPKLPRNAVFVEPGWWPRSSSASGPGRG